MCEIFPEVDKCCFCCSLRIGMLYICILSITSGSIMLMGVEKQLHGDFQKVESIKEIDKGFNKKGVIKDPEAISKEFSRNLPLLYPFSLACMSGLFMAGGLILLYANLTDQEGFIQVFVWLIFLNIVVGMLLSLIVGIECITTEDRCLLKSLDWLTAAVAMVAFIGFLFLWLYFISVANSHVLAVYPPH